MLQLIISTVFVICGCIWNGFELEKVVAHKAGGKHFGLGLTLVQCVLISVVAFSHMCVMRVIEYVTSGNTASARERSVSSSSCATGSHGLEESEEKPRRRRIRPLMTLEVKPALWVAFLFWLTNCINNYVFKFGIAVPIQQLIRSSSLLSSAVTGFYFDGKRFSRWQLLHLFVITVGIAVLSIVGTTSTTTSSSSSSCSACAGGKAPTSSSPQNKTTEYRLFPNPHDPEAVFQWIIGVCLLLVSAFMATFLGMAQTQMYRYSDSIRPGTSKQPGVTEEAIFLSHFLSVGFFALYYGALTLFVDPTTENPVLVFVFKMPSDLQRHIIFNCISQYACIWGVFGLARAADAFIVTMATTVRKFISLVVSIVWFGHASQMTVEQSAAILAVTVSVTVYPFLKSPPPSAAKTVVAATPLSSETTKRGNSGKRKTKRNSSKLKTD